MVQLSDISFGFNKQVSLFQDLNLSLRYGHIYGLFGLNGAGKTTLLNLISGMLFPASGRCTMDGKETRKRLPSTLGDLFIVPEQFELPQVTPTEFINVHKSFYPRFDITEMESLMKSFIIDPHKVLHHHSYGQRKKFLIAFALSTNTRVLLLDEPTNGLDIPSKSQFRTVLSQTVNQHRCTVISTHQVRDLEAIIDHITILHAGKILFNRSAENISQRLTFKQSEGVPPEAIYSEESAGGFNVMLRKLQSESAGPIDLEIFFNAIIQKPEAVNHVFDIF